MESLGWALRVPCVCMYAFEPRTCVPSSKLCLKSNSSMDSHQPCTCPVLAGQHTTVTVGSGAQMGRAKAAHMLRAWAVPQQSVGVKIKLGDGQHGVGDWVTVTVRPSFVWE